MCLINKCKECNKLILLPCNEFCSNKCEGSYNEKVLQMNNKLHNMNPLNDTQQIKKIEPRVIKDFKITLPEMKKLE